MREYILARDKYKPHGRVKILLIAESPPYCGGYFYSDQTAGADSLFRETMKALGIFPENKKMPTGLDKRPCLKEFQSRGFFVVDVSYKPVNKLKPMERRRAIIEGIPRLVADTRELNPESILIVKSNIFAPVRDAIEEAGLDKRIRNEEALPFPSHGHQKTYRRKLRELTNWHTR